MSTNNPAGKNQHTDCPPPDDERVAELLRAYHHKKIMSRKLIQTMLLAEGITMSEATISRRRKALGLLGSGTATRVTPAVVKRQMVLDQMSKDPTSRQGPKTIQEGILFDTGISLTRYVILWPATVHDVYQEGFSFAFHNFHLAEGRTPVTILRIITSPWLLHAFTGA